MAKQTIQSIINQADLQTKKEIKIILDAFGKWSDIYAKAVPGGNKALGAKLVEISSRTASQVSSESILLVSKSTTEGTLNNTYLATLLMMKQRQAS